MGLKALKHTIKIYLSLKLVIKTEFNILYIQSISMKCQTY